MFSPKLKSEKHETGVMRLFLTKHTTMLRPFSMKGAPSSLCQSLRRTTNIRLPAQEQWRHITIASRGRQSIAPTMEQMRAPFSHKNSSTLYGFYQTISDRVLIFNRFYTMSVILGTVALSYGSVPMYKMACVLERNSSTRNTATYTLLDMYADWLGRSTHQGHHPLER